MHLYNNFWRLLKRHWQGMVIYTVILIVMLAIMFSQSGGLSNDVDFEESSFNIAYTDLDDSELSRSLIDYLSSNNTMTDVSGMSEKSVAEQVYFRVENYQMTIPAGFEESVLDGNGAGDIAYYSGIDGSWQTYAINNQINMYIGLYRQYINIGKTSSEAASLTMDSLLDKTEVTIYSSEETNDSSDLVAKMIYNGCQYYMFCAMGMLAMSCGVVIMISSKKELSDRIDISPNRKIVRTLSSFLGLATFAFIMWFFISIVITCIGWGTEFLKNYGWAVYLNTFMGTLVASSFAILITAFDIAENVFSMVINVVGMACAFLGGLFVPMWFMDEKLLVVSRFIPHYWYSYVNGMIANQFEYSSAKVIECALIQLLFSLLLIGATILINSMKRGTAFKVKLSATNK